MRNGLTLSLVIGLLAAYIYHSERRRNVPAAAPPEDPRTVLSDLPDNPANLYYLTKPPWLVVPIRPFRADNRDFPKPHRYIDPQGPIADIYNPNLRTG